MGEECAEQGDECGHQWYVNPLYSLLFSPPFPSLPSSTTQTTHSTKLNPLPTVENFVRDLTQLPAETEILSEAVYVNSQTLDGRRFAEEFVRRRKLADKGIAPEASAGTTFSSGPSTGAGGGWSEVAKKGPEREKEREKASSEVPGQFKVVAGKKKGKR